MDDDCVGDGAIEQSASTSFVVMACIKEKRCFFPSTSCFLKIIFFFFFFFFHQSYYKGYSLHDYKLKNTQECTTQMLTSKPMQKVSVCGVVSPSADLVLQSNLVCVCVCVLPRLKAGSKTNFGVARSFLLPKLRNSKLHSLQLIFGVPSPSFTLLVIMVVVVLVVDVIQKQKKKKK